MDLYQSFYRMASFMRSKQKLTPKDLFQSLNRPISSSELARFGQYTTRVTNLHLHGDMGLNAQIFQTLMGPHESFDWLSLWPRVKTLCWLTSRGTIPFLKYFLAFDVRDLKVNLDGTDDEEFEGILALVESRCMNMKGLHIIDSAIRESKQSQDSIQRIVYNNSLTLRLLYPPLGSSSRLVSDILRLPALQVLGMHIPKIPVHVPLEILPSLERLAFVLDRSSDVIGLLGNLRKSKIRKFGLACHFPTSRFDQVALADLFEDTGLYDSVDTFSWVSCVNDRNLNWGFITTLSPFVNMHSLNLAVVPCTNGCRFVFRHEHVVELSGWMPHLRELRLGGSPCAYGGLATDVGYQTFAVVAKNCPNLSVLSVHFNINTFIYGRSAEVNKNVARWDVGGTMVPTSPSFHTLVALAVSNLFPKTAFTGTTARNFGTWDAIYEEVQMFTLPPIRQLLGLM